MAQAHSHLHDASVCCDGACAEEDEGVQLHRRAARKLRVAVPVVQVGCQLPQRCPILCLCFQDSDTVDSTSRHVCFMSMQAKGLGGAQRLR